VDASLRLPGWLPRGLAHAIDQRWFRRCEQKVMGKLAAGPPRCVHYLYPENSLFQGAEMKGQNKLVLSCHQPATFLQQMRERQPGHPFLQGLNRADCLVLLSQASQTFYRSLAPGQRIEVIPHGVDTVFFQPGPAMSQHPLVITVGSWLRDYDCWTKVVREVSERRPETEFAVVAGPAILHDLRSRLTGMTSRVRWCSGLSDNDLRNLYHEAAVAFLPLREAEANNALLEAMAMGLPLVVSDLPATREYAGPEVIYHRNEDVPGIARSLSELLDDPNRRAAMGLAVRKRAETELAWQVVAGRLRHLYDDLCGGNERWTDPPKFGDSAHMRVP
jgi:glycosyltransferase involved in cell wall biosynthesis